MKVEEHQFYATIQVKETILLACNSSMSFTHHVNFRIGFEWLQGKKQNEEENERRGTRVKGSSSSSSSSYSCRDEARIVLARSSPTHLPHTSLADGQNTILINLDKSIIFPIMTLKEYSHEEHRNCFYEQKEFNLIFKRVDRILTKLEAGALDKNTICTRGLDKLYGERQEICQHIRSKTVNTVLDLQEDYWNIGKDIDQEALAKSCRKISKEASRRAVREARQDTKAAKKYLRDVDTSKWRTDSHDDAKSTALLPGMGITVKSILKVRHPTIGIPVGQRLFPDRACSHKDTIVPSHKKPNGRSRSVVLEVQQDYSSMVDHQINKDLIYHDSQNYSRPTTRTRDQEDIFSTCDSEHSSIAAKEQQEEHGRGVVSVLPTSASLSSPMQQLVPSLDSAQALIPQAPDAGEVVVVPKIEQGQQFYHQDHLSYQATTGTMGLSSKASCMVSALQTKRPSSRHRTTPNNKASASCKKNDSVNEEDFPSSTDEAALQHLDCEEMNHSSTSVSKSGSEDMKKSGGIVAGHKISRFSRVTTPMMPCSTPTHDASPRSVVGKRIKSKRPPKPSLSQSDHGHSRKNMSVGNGGAAQSKEDLLPLKSLSSHC